MGDGNNGINSGQLRSFVERIERVEETIRDEQDARKEIYAELKSLGFDPRIVRKVVSLRRQDRQKRDEEAELLDLYLTSLEQGDLFAEASE